MNSEASGKENDLFYVKSENDQDFVFSLWQSDG
jgi:hypothetical protein